MKSSLLCFMILWNLTLMGGAAIQLKRQMDKVVVSTPKLTFTMANETSGCGFLRIDNKEHQATFLAGHITAAEAKLWRLKLTDEVSNPKRALMLTNRSRARQKKLRVTDRELSILYQEIFTPEGGTVDVQVTMSLDLEGRPDWRIRVNAEKSTYKLMEVFFPELELGYIDGHDGTNDYLLMSPAEGRAVRNPIHFNETLREDQAHFSEETSSPLSGKDQIASTLGFGFGANEPYGLPYPTCRGQMQLNAYYHKTGNFLYPNKGSYGLYLATHDSQARPKVYYATEKNSEKILTYTIGHFPEESQGLASVFEQDFPAYISFFEGDWLDASRIYRRWATKQFWSRRGKLAQRKDIPEWLLRTTAWIRLSNMYGQPMTRFKGELAQYRQLLHGHLGIQYYAWEEGTMVAGCGNFPTSTRAKEGFRDFIGEFQAKNFHVFPYMNSRVWTVLGNQFKESQDFVTYVQRTQSGELRGFMNIPLKAAGKTMHFSTFKMCPFTDFWRSKLGHTASEICERYQPHGLYVDEAGNSAFNVGSCFAQNHGHPLGITTALVQAERSRDMAILSGARRHRPDIVMTGEGNSEVFNDIFASKLIHYEIWPGHVPTFQAVYHDYITSYGRSISFNACKTQDPLFYMQVAWQLVTGSQLGRFWPEKLNVPEVRRYLAYAQECTALKSGAGYPFLALGTMCPFPAVSPIKQVTTQYFSRLNHLCSFPGVLASVWRSPRGRLGVVITNILSEEEQVTLSFNPVDYQLSGTMNVKHLAGTGRIVSSARNHVTVVLPAYTVMLLELSSKK